MSTTFTIVIPCRNEEKYIGLCLDSIIACNYPKEKLEVFICDGMSTDGTREIVKEYSNQNSFIQILDNIEQTTPQALNLGLRKGNGDVKIILGAHAEIYPDYLNECIKAFAINSEIGCVGGLIENEYENEAAQVIGLAMSSPFGVGNAHFRTGEYEGYVDTVAFGAYKKEVFEKIGYFDDNLVRNQDDDYNFRLLKAGYKIYLNKAIRSKYYVRSSYSKLYRQYYQYGYWKVFVNRKHKTVTTIRQLIPPAFVLYLLGGFVLSACFSSLVVMYLSGLIIYLMVGFNFALKMQKSFFSAIKILGVFFILHFSYGLGYLEGIVKFYIFRLNPDNRKKALTR